MLFIKFFIVMPQLLTHSVIDNHTLEKTTPLTGIIKKF